MTDNARPPGLLTALIPLFLLFILLAYNVAVYGDDSLSGANQTALIISAALAAAMTMFQGTTWDKVCLLYTSPSPRDRG